MIPEGVYEAWQEITDDPEDTIMISLTEKEAVLMMAGLNLLQQGDGPWRARSVRLQGKILEIIGWQKGV